MKYCVLGICLIVVISVNQEAIAIEESSLVKDDFLWLEYGEGTKEKDGSLVLELKINYGRFPDKIGKSVGLDNLNAVYTAQSTRTNVDNNLLYKADIYKDISGYSIKIKSAKEERFVLIVTAEKTDNGVAAHYLAKTSFTLFGKSLSEGPERFPESPDSTGRSFEIYIDPEHHFWPQTGNPIKVSPLFNGEMLPEKGISVFDEHAFPVEMTADETGTLVYIPPEDRKLNSMGETAHKQTVLVSSLSDKGIQYISSYTLLLHRSRFGKHELTPGLIVFGSAFVLFLFYMVVKRMRSRF